MGEVDESRAVFAAAFPGIQSAIKIDGAGNGVRIQLDVPESEMGEAVKLLLWRQEVLRVTIEPMGKSAADYGNNRAAGRTKAKKRV